MSAQVYAPQIYQPQKPQPYNSRRAPFSNAVNQPPLPPKPKATAATADGAKPSTSPLERQKSKATPPSPPQVIQDFTGKLQFQRVGFLGQGGFARVYEIKDPRGARLACKVVTKTSLTSKKAKTKLYAEIKIHRSLEHPNIVKFQECFEDEGHVYMTLELCNSGSLMDMLRRRRRISEPETRFFLVQLIGACHYMHTHQVIHRDLKLGNIFLDSNMCVKVGDFGLAALIESPGERKKTICGTPNYIAPEVLFDTANGHSFEVDTWSIGVIIYTLIIGHPPFQTKDVKEIYQRIRDNEYEFPTDRPLSSHSQLLISQILTPDPQKRPTLHEIIDHPFFTQGTVPAYIPASAHDTPPDFRHITRPVSESNLRRLRRYSLLDEDQVTSIAVPKPPTNSAGSSNGLSSSSSMPAVKSMTSSIAQQEKEFQKAVQPGSPISALLSSARQPLVMGTTAVGAGGGGSGAPDTALFRKLQAARESPLRRGMVRGTRGVDGEGAATTVGGRVREEAEDEMKARKKELESQKARIVAQMAPVHEEEDGLEDRTIEVPREPPVPVKVRPVGARERQPKQDTRKESVREKERAAGPVGKENQPSASSVVSTRVPVSAPVPPPVTSVPAARPAGFEAAAQTLTLAFSEKDLGRVFRDPREDPHLPIPVEQVFIVSWVDYCNKYGMGYALTDGSVGVHFNDSTSLVLSPDKQHFDYIAPRKHLGQSVFGRKSCTFDVYPPELKSKVYLMKQFENYIMDRLYGEYDYTFEDVERTKGMEWVQKYLRMKNVIVFKLSHDVIQFNFYDHSKLILSSHGLMVTHIDKDSNIKRWTLADIMAQALNAPPPSEMAFLSEAAVEQLRFLNKLVEKLRYCKTVLVSIGAGVAAKAVTTTAPTAGAGGSSEEESAPGAMAIPPQSGTGPSSAFGGSLGTNARRSKTSLLR